ncbi:MAG: PKD domain-containing protein [Saprospiraceae bacterium]|nr:PKD domain-containing protein [Saprospiraceae bacterium]
MTDLRDSFITLDLSNFSKNNFLQTLAGIQAENNSLQSELDFLGADLEEIITSLEDNPQTVDNLPVADAGGPYIGTEGSSISFDGTASTSSSLIVLYEWDIDGDGEFDDVTGPTPSFTFHKAFIGLLGIRVTDEDGFSNINYARIEISNVNNPPQITGFTPSSKG